MTILERLQKQILFFDGGTGSLLQAKGLRPGELPETWNILHPEIITELHADYLAAGAHIINTNTFGANALKFPGGDTYSVDEIVTAAVNNAKAAVTASGREDAYVALDMGPTGKLLEPLGDLSFERAYELYAEVVTAGAKAGADLILIETMGDTYEIKAAVLAARENSNLPIFVTVTFDEKGTLLTGANIPAVIALLEGLRVDAIGMNCGLGPKQMRGLAEQFLSYASLPVIVNPNAGLPRTENGKTVYDVTANEFAEIMADIVSMGARIVGGCCGTTPLHIKNTVELIKDFPPVPVTPKNISLVSSYSQAVVIGEDPIIVGERINPTGKKKLKEALKTGDMEYILKEGLTQQSAGAHVLDVNVGLPEIDEATTMVTVIRELQGILALPLQIDTADPAVLEHAMRIYNGKPLVNSVNGKEESMEAVFPLVARYGGVVVALTLDENGIPATAEGRLSIAKKILKRAADYGIDKKDIIIDCLAMTISSDPHSAKTTLEAVRRVKEELHVHSILGVSNISFGLPNRPIINSAFFTMALQNGLSAAIINPSSEDMMRSYRSYRALAALDAQCNDYIAMYSGQTTAMAATAKTEDMTLSLAIQKGLSESAAKAARELLATKAPLDIINEEMIPALDIVGKGFENKTIFLPQLLMSAEASKAAFAEIKEFLSASGKTEKKKATIVIATVKGDIHDIGKNIVKVLLENYSYDVIDLGKDVPPEQVADAVIKTHAPLAGLSALMTTTVPSMEETIRLLHEKAPWCKIMVGGAVLTQEYADMIGADYYAKDALASVHYAESIL